MVSYLSETLPDIEVKVLDVLRVLDLVEKGEHIVDWKLPLMCGEVLENVHRPVNLSVHFTQAEQRLIELIKTIRAYTR